MPSSQFEANSKWERGVLFANTILANPSARSVLRFSASMSLYRAGLELASFLPLGVAIPVWV